MQIKVNKVNLNYEIFGEGKPLILLHGNGENYKIFDKLIKDLEPLYKIYAIDSRCHGKSAKTKEINYELMRDDIIEFIYKLKINKPILYGFSDGGIVGLMIAIKDKNILSKLIVSGANLNPDGFNIIMKMYTKIGYFITRSKLFKMMRDEPNIMIEELQDIEIPVVVLAGEKDIVKLEHTNMIYNNLKKAKLEIIPHENHGSYIIHSHKIYKIIKKYL